MTQNPAKYCTRFKVSKSAKYALSQFEKQELNKKLTEQKAQLNKKLSTNNSQ